MTNDRTAAEVPGGTPVERPVVRLVPERVVQARAMPPSEQPWLAAGASLVATRESILAAMRDLHDNATDTVWLTPHETVFERLASIYGYAGGDPATLAAMWPEYFA